MRWWERQIGGKARGRIIALLRRGDRTADEIAKDLRVTPNAVRLHLQLLEREGIVRHAGTRPHEGAGKPATVFSMAHGADAALSGAYAPVLTALLDAMRDRLTKRQIDDLLTDAGARLAPAQPGKASLESRVRSAATLLREFGAELDVERTSSGFRLNGHACPLSAAVRAEPRACLAVQELVKGIVDAPVRECCDRSDRPRCQFEISSRAS